MKGEGKGEGMEGIKERGREGKGRGLPPLY